MPLESRSRACRGYFWSFLSAVTIAWCVDCASRNMDDEHCDGSFFKPPFRARNKTYEAVHRTAYWAAVPSLHRHVEGRLPGSMPRRPSSLCRSEQATSFDPDVRGCWPGQVALRPRCTALCSVQGPELMCALTGTWLPSARLHAGNGC